MNLFEQTDLLKCLWDMNSDISVVKQADLQSQMNIHGQHLVCCALKSASFCQEKPELEQELEQKWNKSSCSVPRDSYFPLLLNQEAAQLFRESWVLNTKRKISLFTFRQIFPTFLFYIITEP